MATLASCNLKTSLGVPQQSQRVVTPIDAIVITTSRIKNFDHHFRFLTTGLHCINDFDHLTAHSQLVGFMTCTAHLLAIVSLLIAIVLELISLFLNTSYLIVYHIDDHEILTILNCILTTLPN